MKHSLPGLRPAPKPLPRKLTYDDAMEIANQRLSVLAMELARAGAVTLREDFGFSVEMTDAWMQKMLARAQGQRE
jgi:hypothetical protein